MTGDYADTAWQPPPAQHRCVYDAIPTGYYDAVFHRRCGIQSKWHHLKFDRLRRAMAGLTDHLDIGCGAGTLVGTLGSGHRSVGVDIAAGQIAYAQDHYGSPERRFQRIEPGPLPFPDSSFDAVTAVELIEHLPHDQNVQLLKEAGRTLRPGGRLILSTPNYASLWPVLESLVNRFGGVSYADQHITRYTRSRLAALIAGCGFVDVAVEAYQGLAPFAAVFGWRLADRIARLEPAALVARCGFLLVGTGTLPR